MNPTLTLRLANYLAVRRDFGFDLADSARVLRRFAEFADGERASHVTVDLFLRWKAHFGSANSTTWSARLGMVRGFARWLQSVDPRTEMPPSGLIHGKRRRPRPYIYSAAEIARIVAQAARLPSAYGLRGWTYATLFGLIASTGLRINEAIKLDEADVVLRECVLVIRHGKNGRERLVPVSTSVAMRLKAYRAERDRLLEAGHVPFFLTENGTRPTDCSARYNFALVCQRTGLRTTTLLHKHGRGPRIHDLRHTFAVRTLVEWYRKGLDPDREMHTLSTYLGHTDPEHTYWYIEAVPELLQLASQRAEQSLTARGDAA